MNQYYIDGTIDSIELAIGGNPPLKFSLLPSEEFLKTVAEGKKRALFVEDVATDKEKDSSGAVLKKAEVNESGKDILNFSVSKSKDTVKCLLLEAKNNRNTIRVFVQSTTEKDHQKKSAINFTEPVRIAIL